MLGKAIVVICQKSRPSFTMIWCSGGSVRRSANKEFPTLHNHRFPLGKLRFTALKCISSAAYSPYSSGPPLSPATPRLPHHIARDSPASLPVYLRLPSFLLLPPFSIPPCRAPHNQCQTSFNLPVDAALVCTCCFVICDTCGFLFSCFHTNANMILLL